MSLLAYIFFVWGVNAVHKFLLLYISCFVLLC